MELLNKVKPLSDYGKDDLLQYSNKVVNRTIIND